MEKIIERTDFISGEKEKDYRRLLHASIKLILYQNLTQIQVRTVSCKMQNTPAMHTNQSGYLKI